MTAPTKDRRTTNEERCARKGLNETGRIYRSVRRPEHRAESSEQESEWWILPHVRPSNSINLRSCRDVVATGWLFGKWCKAPWETIGRTELWVYVDDRRPIGLQSLGTHRLSHELSTNDRCSLDKICWLIGRRKKGHTHRPQRQKCNSRTTKKYRTANLHHSIHTRALV